MARYRNYNYEQTKLLPIRYSEQILPGTFEYALNDVINKADLTVFDARYQNDVTGAPAYDPWILLKIIRFADARGIFSSRRIERLCRENVVMMALSADTQPDFTTITEFVSSASDEIVVLFREVLLIGDAMGLIGKELFAIDGCKLASNASKEWSGTKADLAKKHRKLTRAIRVMLARHRQQDAHEASGAVSDQARQYLATLRARAQKIRQFLATHPENVSPTGTIRQSNLTDPESAKMKTAHGVLQGYNGISAVDSKHQVIVHAEAFGEGQSIICSSRWSRAAARKLKRSGRRLMSSSKRNWWSMRAFTPKPTCNTYSSRVSMPILPTESSENAIPALQPPIAIKYATVKNVDNDAAERCCFAPLTSPTIPNGALASAPPASAYIRTGQTSRSAA